MDEFALPSKLKKIKPLEWYADEEGGGGETAPSSTAGGDHLGGGMENELLYSYQGLLIRIVGIDKSLEMSRTSRKVSEMLLLLFLLLLFFVVLCSLDRSQMNIIFILYTTLDTCVNTYMRNSSSLV